jgi:hypothetical protein
LAPTDSETKVQHEKRLHSLKVVIDWVREFEVQDEKQFPQSDYARRFYRIADILDSRIPQVFIES